MKFKRLLVSSVLTAVLAYAQTASHSTATKVSATSQPDQHAAALQEKISALQELRDSGVITDQEYQAKVSALQNNSVIPAVAKGPKISWSGTRTEQAMDPHFGVPAMTMQVPVGWKFAGDISSSGKGTCHTGDPSLHLTEESPDGAYQIIQLPGVTWRASNSDRVQGDMERKGCPSIWITSAAGFLANVLLPQLHSNSKIVRVDPAGPSLIQAIWKKLQADKDLQEIFHNAVGNPMGEFKTDGAEMRVQYEMNGRAMEEKLTGFVICHQMQLMDSSFMRFCYISGISIVRAPQGRLDDFLAMPESAEIMKTEVNPEWTRQVREDFKQRMIATISNIRQQQAMSEAMIRASWANFNNMMAQSQIFFNQLAENNRQENAQMAARTQASINESRDLQNRMDIEAHKWTLFAGDKMENINPYNGETVVTSNKFARQFISSDSKTWVGTNGYENPNDYVGPGGPTFAPLIPK